MSDILVYYKKKHERKKNLLSKLQLKANDIAYEMSAAESINLYVLQAEVRLIAEVIEDFGASK